jgi:hypothetical protein
MWALFIILKEISGETELYEPQDERSYPFFGPIYDKLKWCHPERNPIAFHPIQ